MKKELFLYVYKNKILNTIINQHIRYIHKKIYKNRNCEKLNWKQLIDSIEALTQYGYLEQLRKRADLNTYYMRDRCSKIAARYGRLHILKAILDGSAHFVDSYTMERILVNALMSGHIPVIEYIHSFRTECSIDFKDLIQHTAVSGNVKVCEWYYDHFKDIMITSKPNVQQFFYKAMLYGNLDVVKWGIQIFKDGNILTFDSDPFISTIWRNAITSKNISLLDYMHNHELFKNTFNSADFISNSITTSNTNTIEWVLSKGDVNDCNNKYVFMALIRRSSIKTIEYISTVLNSRVGNQYKNTAEWLFKSCEHLGFNALDYAIEQKMFKMVKWIFANTDFQSTANGLEKCDQSFDILKWYTENNRPEIIPQETLYRLLRYRFHLRTVEYIVRNRTEQFPNDVVPNVMDLILSNSTSVELASWMLENKKVVCTSYAFDKAIRSDRMDVVKWIHENTTVGCSNSGVEDAYFLTDSSMLLWLNQNRTETCDPRMITTRFHRCIKSIQSFIIYNKPDMIPRDVFRYIKDDISLSKFIIDTYPTKIIDISLLVITKTWNLDIIKYLHEYYKKHGIYPKTNFFHKVTFKISLYKAIKKGNIDIVKYFCENGPKFGKSTGKKLVDDPMMAACKYGDLEICQYLQDHTPYTLKPEHMTISSTNGNLQIVEWISSKHGIECSKSAFKNTVSQGHYDVARYLIETNNDLVTTELFKYAITRSDLELVQLCLESGYYPYDFNPIGLASSSGSLEIVKCFIEEFRFEGTSDAIDSAIEHGHYDIVKFLRDNYYEGSSKSIQSGVDDSNIELLNLFYSNIETP